MPTKEEVLNHPDFNIIVRFALKRIGIFSKNIDDEIQETRVHIFLRGVDESCAISSIIYSHTHWANKKKNKKVGRSVVTNQVDPDGFKESPNKILRKRLKINSKMLSSFKKEVSVNKIEEDVNFNTIDTIDAKDSIEEIMLNIPEYKKEILRRIYYEGKSQAGVARELGCTRAAVSEQINLLFKKIKKVHYEP